MSSRKLYLEEDIAVHIFVVSATMVGVCLTVIGIIGIIAKQAQKETLADDILVLAAVVFLMACGLSYWALRTRHLRRMIHIEKAADALFIIGLCMMAAVAALVTYFLF